MRAAFAGLLHRGPEGRGAPAWARRYVDNAQSAKKMCAGCCRMVCKPRPHLHPRGGFVGPFYGGDSEFSLRGGGPKRGGAGGGTPPLRRP